MIKKIFLFVLICTIVVNLFPKSAVAVVTDASDNMDMELSDTITSESIPNSQQIESKNTLSLQIDSTAIHASDSVELTLPDDILSYSFDADGITVTEAQTDRIHFHVKPVERLGFFNICANYADGTIGEDTIYFFRDYDMTFVSNFTLDDAFHKGMQFLLEQGTITTYEYEQKYAELTQNYISTFDINSTGHTPVDMETAEALTITTSTTSNTISVSGYAYWKPSSNTVLPLKYAKISFLELTNLGYNELDNVYTDLNGYFSFEIAI